MRTDRRLLLGAALGWCFVAVGCIGAGEPPSEDQGAADSLAYKSLTLTAEHTVGWPNLQERYEGVSHVTQQDDQRVAVSSDLVVFGAVEKSLEFDLDEPNWYWMVGTMTAVIVLHREQGAADDVPWTSLRCGDNYQHLTNDYRLFADGVSIDLESKTVNGWSFAACGIARSENPQFAVFVAPWKDAFSMVGDYSYAVSAECDSGACTNERGLYPDAHFADNPPPEADPTDPAIGRDRPADVVRGYYKAIGEGRVDEVVATWTGLDANAQSRLRQVASYGEGYSWELPVARETIRNSGFAATVEVEVTATKGSARYSWSGTIDLALVVNLRTQTTAWKITAMHLTQH